MKCAWCLVFLVTGCVASSGDVETIEYSGYNGQEETIRQPLFGQGYLLSNIVYNITVTNLERSYIRLEFTDFDIHPASVLKIYDGRPWENPVSSFWHQGAPPIYYSKSGSVQLVWKPLFEPDGSVYGHEYSGFIVKAKYMLNPRNFYAKDPIRSEHMDTNGYCGRMEHENKWSTGAVEDSGKQWTPVYSHRHPSGSHLNFSCIWNQTVSTNSYHTFYLTVRTNMAASMRLVVKEGRTTEGATIPEWKRETIAQITTYITYKVTDKAFYIKFDAVMMGSDYFAFAYHWSSYDAQVTVHSMLPAPRGDVCPQKRCPNGDCTFYWASCSGSHSDPSCDGFGPDSDIEYCSSASNRCFHNYDKCDSFNDCQNKEDEDCSVSIVSQIWNIAGPLLFFVMIIIGFGILKGICKGICKAKDNLGECCTGLCECVSDGCSACLRKISNCHCFSRAPSSESYITSDPHTSPATSRRNSVITSQVSATRVDPPSTIATWDDDSMSDISISLTPEPSRRTPRAPSAPAAHLEPNAPPDYFTVVNDPSSRPVSIVLTDNQELPSYDQVLTGEGGRRIPVSSQPTPSMPPPSYESVTYDV